MPSSSSTYAVDLWRTLWNMLYVFAPTKARCGHLLGDAYAADGPLYGRTYDYSTTINVPLILGSAWGRVRGRTLMPGDLILSESIPPWGELSPGFARPVRALQVGGPWVYECVSAEKLPALDDPAAVAKWLLQ